MLELDKKETYKLPIKNGYLEIIASQDPDYPGLDIEYIEEYHDTYTRPRVLFECPKDTDILRCLVWDNPTSEDYSTKAEFDTASDRQKRKRRH